MAAYWRVVDGESSIIYRTEFLVLPPKIYHHLKSDFYSSINILNSCTLAKDPKVLILTLGWQSIRDQAGCAEQTKESDLGLMLTAEIQRR